ncbi:S-adenosyl-l-methionine hydroxide adenosyltransferase family protein [Anaerococcus sp. AGMB00486]|uniref:S-adenosyl-l-methionine hydroxide adenosyltransferase family protein n=2 Tax=Anaerococcus TaxID=165779 RepID=A0ABX2N9Z8_9FIRM|nr:MULTISPECIES: S-adenosyl-l-methionine hydroxide adenosyltransferase family protein [Anaerococcus]MDY3005923.1 S-adenosyl-l-methionine hydroxide adenosyltransferase family protein [Anaerococcus porci]MSS77639.1 S-adenosyl-l-methionine hydroxide adenosyltransferase family protein [Anaerococcus porci]NVF11493.1 S-adenosyl-l-methionine hydroxide adenosyltransferase family protein [Anaerococcus faecalis]
MSTLVFQSDFGLGDGAVSAMHGVSNMVNPDIKVDDLTHEIKPYDIFEASYRLLQTISYWPEGTVFVSVVDPGVGSDRHSIVVKTNSNHYIVTPDNGTISHVAKFIGLKSAKIIDELKDRLPFSENSHTFHGRDVYAYNGAKLATNEDYYEKLKSCEIKNLVIKDIKEATITNGVIEGTIDILDIRFGSLWTNISLDLLKKVGINQGDSIKVTIYNKEIKKYENQMTFGHSFSDVALGETIAYINSLINLGIAINQASFSDTYQIGTGSDWIIYIRKEK